MRERRQLVYWTLVHWTLVARARARLARLITRMGMAQGPICRRPNLPYTAPKRLSFMNRTIMTAIAVWMAAACLSGAATIPAGTVLMARTVEPISSHERVGAPCKVALEQDVVVNGKVLLRAGTPLTGIVETSLRTPPTSGALRVNLKALLVNGRSVPVQTTGAFRLDRFKTKRGVSVSGREWNFPYGTRMAFRLAQPVAL